MTCVVPSVFPSVGAATRREVGGLPGGGCTTGDTAWALRGSVLTQPGTHVGHGTRRAPPGSPRKRPSANGLPLNRAQGATCLQFCEHQEFSNKAKTFVLNLFFFTCSIFFSRYLGRALTYKPY